MKITKFEDIIAWKKARELNKRIFTITNQKGFLKDFELKNQIRRASISVMSNIAEGFGRQTDKEFKQFLFMAKGSASEVQSQLYIAFDVGYITKEEFEELYILTEEVCKLLYKFIQYLK